MLTHINREVGCHFEVENFSHRAVWNEHESRIEMHLVSGRPQMVEVGDTTIAFGEGETIHTENSYKHSVAALRQMAQAAGWRAEAVWTDSEKLFSIHLLQSYD